MYTDGRIWNSSAIVAKRIDLGAQVGPSWWSTMIEGIPWNFPFIAK